MADIAIIVLAFLAVTLPIAAIRACNTLRAHEAANKPDPRRETVYYTGPSYSVHGNEIKGR